MKKILTVILLATFLMPYAYAAEVDVYDVDDKRVQEAINFFDDLGLVSIYKDNSFRGFEKVTRRDMAILIYEMLGGGVGSCNYKDVSSDDAGYDAIGFVTGRKIMNGTGDGKFRPDDYIMCRDAVKTVVSTLGYEMTAQQKGGYPNGYITVANELGITTDFNMTEYITKNELFVLLHEAYDAPIMTYEMESGKVSYGSDEDVTLLSYYRDIYEYKGIVTGSYLTELNQFGETSLTENQIMIDGVVYETTVSGPERFLGYYVEYFVEEKEDDTVVSIKLHKSNKEITVHAEDILPESTKSRLRYVDENNKTKSVNISPIADFVYNREAVPGFDGKKLIPGNGFVKLLDNDGDSKYDVVFIEDYETFPVERIMTNGVPVNKFKSDGTQQLDIGEFSKTDVIEIEKNGEKVSVNDLKANDVLSVMISESGEILTAEVSSESVTGTVTGINNNEGTITIDNTSEYIITPELKRAWENGDVKKPALNEFCTVYTDVFSNAAYISIGTTGNIYGYLRKITYNEDAESAQFRVFNIADGSWNTFVSHPKMTVNGTEVKDFSKIRSFVTEKQLIRFKANGDGKIRELETATIYTADEQAQAVENDKFRAMATTTSTRWRYQNASINSQYYMTDDTLVAYIPVSESHADEESYYALEKYTSYKGDSIHNFQVFDYDEEMCVKVLLRYGEGGGGSTDVSTGGFLIIDEVYESLNGDGDEVAAVKCLYGGREITLYTTEFSKELFMDAQKGDIVQVSLDADGRLFAEEEIFTVSDGWITKPTYVTNFHDLRNIIAAEVSRVGEVTNGYTTTGGDYNFRHGGSVYVYDMKNDEFYVGTKSDMEVGDFVVIRYRESSVQEIVVYKR